MKKTDYLVWDEIKINDYAKEEIDELYNKGFLFTRKEKGNMQKTRSVRIDLSRFSLNSENRRILKKTENIKATEYGFPWFTYDWSIGKLAKDFYDTKFEKGIFSTQKIKEIFNAKNNFNYTFAYELEDTILGYSICYFGKKIIHYSYPFYNLEKSPKDIGLGMMLKAIVWAKEKGYKYFYLGSLQRPSDTYKLQFEGLEWFDEENWQDDLEEIKKILQNKAPSHNEVVRRGQDQSFQGSKE